MYCIGESAGFMGSNGLNPIHLVILVNANSRANLQCRHFSAKYRKPMGRIRHVIPHDPHDKNHLIDACLAFMPDYFADCPSMNHIKEELKDVKWMDFNLNKNIPESWATLRKEAKENFEKLVIYSTNFFPLDESARYPSRLPDIGPSVQNNAEGHISDMKDAE